MKLYFAKGACSLAVRIALNELDFDCSFESVDLRAKKTATGQDYWTCNPKGGVPALVLDSGDILTEGAIIQQYLADQRADQTLLPALGLARYRVLEWMNYVATELHKSCSPLFSPTLPENLKQEIFAPILKTKLEYVSKQLGSNAYLLGNEYRLVDGYLLTILSWAPNWVAYGIKLSDWKNLEQYVMRLKKRPAVVKAFADEGLA